MPPYRHENYDPGVNATTIAELIGAPARAQARAAELSGVARAQMAHAIGQAGTDITTSARQLVEQRKTDAMDALRTKETEQRITANDLQLSGAARAAKGRDALASAIQQAGGDHKKVYDTMIKAGFPDVAEGYVESTAKAEKTWRELKDGALTDADKATAFEADQLQRILGLPQPARQGAWTAVQGTLKAHGVNTEGLAPEWDDAGAQAQLALTGPKPNLMEVDPTKSLIDKNNPTAPPILTGQPKAPNSQESTFRLNGKDVLGDYIPGADGKPGKYFYNGQDVTGQIAKVPPASTIINPGTAEDIDDNARQLFLGNILPADLSKRGNSYNATLAKANRMSLKELGKPLNVNKLKLDYEAAKRFAGSMNGNQMVKFKGLADSVVNTIDEVRRLGDELKQGGIQKWNAVKRGTIQQVYGNTPQSELANQYVGAVNTLKEEFANLANGGYAPTEAAWKLADQQINGDFGFKDLNASLSEVQRLINYRVNAFNELTPTYTPSPGTAGAPPPTVPVPPAAPAGTVRMRAPNGQEADVAPDHVAAAKAKGAVEIK